MKYYLSSYKLGREIETLRSLIKNVYHSFGYIPNALDFTGADPARKTKHIAEDMADLSKYGAKVEILDLKDYFGKEKKLKQKLETLGGVYVSGGNVFVLRQAMRLSALDIILQNRTLAHDFLYIGYSAGVCVLSPTLTYYAQVDNSNDYPYPELKTQIWEGLGVLDFVFEPHYNSVHPESLAIDKEVKKLIEEKVLFKAYRDGEVLIIED
jgi:dipeptidase E